MKEIVFDKDFLADLTYWTRTNPRMALKVLELIEAVRRDPFFGIGKPEPLCHLGSNIWSRRINQEHQIVYCVTMNKVIFAQARYHY
ncbi:MAG: addiction module toxin YoeB [Verrucomicrobia bacterium RIFCSPHIGHO2_12_FULL_41_10]|nr:MAG: addiction module toxin YoeB [Verrucomicrobia bacterium RIFCSPHIGHO2_12_FULL_41_10]HLB33618.1 Txe/YoeB family addiction module toxin [Chthoniobacterales bacterium]